MKSEACAVSPQFVEAIGRGGSGQRIATPISDVRFSAFLLRCASLRILLTDSSLLCKTAMHTRCTSLLLYRIGGEHDTHQTHLAVLSL